MIVQIFHELRDDEEMEKTKESHNYALKNLIMLII